MKVLCDALGVYIVCTTYIYDLHRLHHVFVLYAIKLNLYIIITLFTVIAFVADLSLISITLIDMQKRSPNDLLFII